MHGLCIIFISSSAVNDLTNDDTRNIRCSLLGLVKYYVTYDISSGELDAIFSFLSASNSNAVQVSSEIYFFNPACSGCFFVLAGLSCVDLCWQDSAALTWLCEKNSLECRRLAQATWLG